MALVAGSPCGGRQSELEALAEFVRREKDRLAPQAHGNENWHLSAVSLYDSGSRLSDA